MYLEMYIWSLHVIAIDLDCGCYADGTMNNGTIEMCDPITGICDCEIGYTNDICGECSAGYYNDGFLALSCSCK